MLNIQLCTDRVTIKLTMVGVFTLSERSFIGMDENVYLIC